MIPLSATIISKEDLSYYRPTSAGRYRDRVPSVYTEGFSIEELYSHVMKKLGQRLFLLKYQKKCRNQLYLVEYPLNDVKEYAKVNQQRDLLHMVERDIEKLHECITVYWKVHKLIKKDDSGPSRPPYIQVAMPNMIAVKTYHACELLSCSQKTLICWIRTYNIEFINPFNYENPWKYRKQFLVSGIELVFEKNSVTYRKSTVSRDYIFFDDEIEEVLKDSSSDSDLFPSSSD
jgi:hypothetical protein